jgi:four helix bundle protein
MKIERFEDIIAWQKGQELTVLAFRNFRNNKDFTFRNQIFGALYSITNNIAEGFERRSNKEFRQFLFISKGSAGEVRNMLYVAKAVDYIKEPEFKAMFDLCETISKLLSGFIKSLQM